MSKVARRSLGLLGGLVQIDPEMVELDICGWILDDVEQCAKSLNEVSAISVAGFERRGALLDKTGCSERIADLGPGALWGAIE